jgi:hypothetical protein
MKDVDDMTDDELAYYAVDGLFDPFKNVTKLMEFITNGSPYEHIEIATLNDGWCCELVKDGQATISYGCAYEAHDYKTLSRQCLVGTQEYEDHEKQIYNVNSFVRSILRAILTERIPTT